MAARLDVVLPLPGRARGPIEGGIRRSVRGTSKGTAQILGAGACRHLIKDRLARTGARWSVEGAEAVLKLRAIISNGHWDEYWRHHLTKEHQRVHQSRYANNKIPLAA